MDTPLETENISPGNRKKFIVPVIVFFILSLGIISLSLRLKNKRIVFKQKAAGNNLTTVDFVPDKIFGQPDFTETAPNQIVGNRVFHPQGVLVDRNSIPNKVYVWDSGNSRVLGFSSLGVCNSGGNSGQPCTNDLDCPSSTCQINQTKEADLVIGQIDMFHAACNGDNTQRMPASASTLCSQAYPDTISLMESPEGNSLAVDVNHNLFVYDKFNNRVLKYNDPFTTDTIADFVWGQANFTDRGNNRGGNVANNTLKWGYFGSGDYAGGGVEIDEGGNLWVADQGNRRVLRFPPNSKEADLVIGQQNFTSSAGNACGFSSGNPPANFLCMPKLVRVSKHTGQLFVVDWSGGGPEHAYRILIYNPPFSNGMSASEVIIGNNYTNYPFKIYRPIGLEIDPWQTNAFWLSNNNLNKLDYFQKIDSSWQITKSLTDELQHPNGSIGIDSAGNIYADTLAGQEVKIFYAPNYSQRTTILRSPDSARGSPNKVSAYGLRDPGSATVINYSNGQKQLFVSDRSRVLFWNNYESKNSGAPADGVLFESNFETLSASGEVFNFSTDTVGRVWMARGNQINVFQGPVINHQSPNYIIPSTVPLRFGGNLTFGMWITGIAYDETNDALWLSDTFNHRLVRMSKPLDSTNRKIDMVIGQPSLDSIKANRGVDNRDALACPNMVPDGFGSMGQIVFDPAGNLYVIDGSREGWQCSNNRLLEFDRETLVPNPSKNFFANDDSDRRYPKRVYGGSGFQGNKNSYVDCSGNKPNTPIGVSFYNGKMLVTADAYGVSRDKCGGVIGNPLGKRVFLYNNPLPDCPTSCRVESSSVIPIAGAQLSNPTWDNDGNLIILDHTWNRVLFFNTPLGVNPDSLTPTPTLTITPTPNPQVFNLRTMVVGMNPVENGKDLVSEMWGYWGKSAEQIEDEIVNMTINDIKSLSNNTINYEIVKKIRSDQFPPYTNGFQYNFDTYRPCVQEAGNPTGICETQKKLFDHIKWVTDNRICEIAEENNIDEIWAIFPTFLTTWENFMIGPDKGFYINGSDYILPQCKKHIIFTTGNYHEIKPLTHVYGHRIESTMSYEITDYWKTEDKNKYWFNFWDRNATAYCGSVHFPSNTSIAYDYSNTAFKDSSCLDWKNFPNFQGLKENINCNAWGCNDAGWEKFWMGSLPRSSGEISMISNSNIAFSLKKNWWYYLLYPENTIALIKTMSGENTTTPSPTPTPTISSCQCPDGVPAKNKGNANCDGGIDIRDLMLWREERTVGTAVNADFNCDGVVNLVDLMLWRENHN